MLSSVMSFRYSFLGTEGETQIFSIFRAIIGEDLKIELLARGVTELEKTNALVQDLDVVRSNHAFRSHDQKIPVSRASLSIQPNRSFKSHIRMMLRERALNRPT